MHERVVALSICTVQAPHSAMPQPNFVPVILSMSRNTQSSGRVAIDVDDARSTIDIDGKGHVPSPFLRLARATYAIPFFSRDVDHHLQNKLKGT